jgi:hypothetical protein
MGETPSKVKGVKPIIRVASPMFKYFPLAADTRRLFWRSKSGESPAAEPIELGVEKPAPR